MLNIFLALDCDIEPNCNETRHGISRKLDGRIFHTGSPEIGDAQENDRLSLRRSLQHLLQLGNGHRCFSARPDRQAISDNKGHSNIPVLPASLQFYPARGSVRQGQEANRESPGGHKGLMGISGL